MKTRIELTDEVIKAITMCCPLAHDDNTELCDTHCALAGACLEYYTGDDSQNKGRETKMEKIIVEMEWEVPNKCSIEQRIHLHNMIDTFMNNVAEKFAWYEETFSIENKTEESETK